jgi:excisionase family DNA binding protein
MPKPDPQVFYTPDQFAQIIQYSRAAVMKLIHAGHIRSVQFVKGGEHRIPHTEIERLQNLKKGGDTE